MTNESERFEVEFTPSERRYVLRDREADGKVIGQERYLDLDVGGETHRIFFHTEVDEDYGGQGLASVLVRAAVEGTVANDLKVVPVCPYVVSWARKNDEFAEHVVTARPEHVRALEASQK